MTRIASRKEPPQPHTKKDPFFYGWRFVRETTPEGDVVERQVPLTEDDVLHPQEEDFIVNTARHDRIATYLKLAMQFRVAGRKDIVVIGNMRVDWGSKHGWAHGPDVAVFGGIKIAWSEEQGTFHVRRAKAKPLMVVEATSPSTRGNDFGPKLRQYFLVGVPVYVIIDVPYDGEAGDVQLFGFQAGKTQYEPLPKDERGRLWLEAVGLWLGVENHSVYLEDAAGLRLPDYEELARQRQAALQKASEEAKARQAAEAKLRELEAKLARRDNEKQ